MAYVFQCDMCKKFHPEVKHAATIRFEQVFSLKGEQDHLLHGIEACNDCIDKFHDEITHLNKRLGIGDK